MAHVVYMGVQTAQVLSGVSNRIMLTSVELPVHAAATALKAIRSSNTEGADQKNLVDHPMVKEELETMDIEAKLKTVHALVLTIQKQRGKSGSIHANGEESAVPEERDESDVVGVCLEQVKEVLDSITITVNALNEELDMHEQRWFSTWRTPDTKHYLIALRAKILILDKRLDMLLKVRSFVSEPIAPNPTSSLSIANRLPLLEYAAGSYGKQPSYAVPSM
jgi:hypothetical protein